MAERKADLQYIDLKDIARSTRKLREVDRNSQPFIQLRDDIANRGVINPISVRPLPDGSECKYELIDGLHRFMASMEAGKTKIPCQILYDMTENDILATQLVANLHVIKTKPVEFSKQIHRLLGLNLTLTVPQLSQQLSVSPAFINERMNLIKLDEKIAPLVDEGKINLTNAYSLARLPVDEQPNYVSAAMNDTPEEFSTKVNIRTKEIREAERAGRKPGAAVFTPVAKIRKRSELINEVEKPQVIPMLIKQLGIKDPVEAAIAALKWTVQMDDMSIKQQTAKYEQHQQEMEAARKKRAAEKAKKAAEMQAAVEN